MTRQALLQALFYDLLRDGAPAGDVEHAVAEFEQLCYGRFRETEEVKYSNKHIAGYANELAKRVVEGIDRRAEDHDDPSHT